MVKTSIGTLSYAPFLEISIEMQTPNVVKSISPPSVIDLVAHRFRVDVEQPGS